MESELQNLNPDPPTKQPDPDAAVTDDLPLLTTTDDRPLLTNTDDKKFAPFVRHDAYGPMGRGELPTREKFLLGVALVTLVPFRLVAGTVIVFLYFLVCKVCTLHSAPNRNEKEQQQQQQQQKDDDYLHVIGWRRTVIVQCGKSLSRLMLFVLGFYYITHSYRISPSNIENNTTTTTQENNTESEDMGRPGVIISNHVSYLDILYHVSSSFPSFVAKRSVAKLPLLGLVSKCLGCILVQRESKSSDFKGVSAVITERIRDAHQNTSSPIVMLFPEGTTSNGEFLLPFKTGGFLSKAPVLPVILSYPYQRFSPAWESISGVRHAIFMLCQFVNYMEVTQLPTYYPSQEEQDDPKLYANNVRRLMASEGNLILSDIGLAEKRMYQADLDAEAHNSRLKS